MSDREEFTAAPLSVRYPRACEGCGEPSYKLTRIEDTGGPDGEFCDDCVAEIRAPECTCYESVYGHMPGCYFNRKPAR